MEAAPPTETMRTYPVSTAVHKGKSRCAVVALQTRNHSAAVFSGLFVHKATHLSLCDLVHTVEISDEL